jgi:hypothetical protein
MSAMHGDFGDLLRLFDADFIDEIVVQLVLRCPQRPVRSPCVGLRMHIGSRRTRTRVTRRQPAGVNALRSRLAPRFHGFSSAENGLRKTVVPKALQGTESAARRDRVGLPALFMAPGD